MLLIMYEVCLFFPVAGVDPSSRMRQVPLARRVISELPTPGRNDQHSLSRDSAQNHISRETVQRYNNAEATVLSTSRETIEPFNGRGSSEHFVRRGTAHSSISVDAYKFPTVTEASEQAPVREHTELNPVSATAVENEDALMQYYMEPPFILSGERKFPFIYFASLSAQWEAVKENKPSVQGKIKVIYHLHMLLYVSRGLSNDIIGIEYVL